METIKKGSRPPDSHEHQPSLVLTKGGSGEDLEEPRNERGATLWKLKRDQKPLEK